MSVQPVQNILSSAVAGAQTCFDYGWGVFPTDSDTKQPLLVNGSRWPWSQRLLTSHEEIGQYVGQSQSYGVAMKASGLLVIDDDGNGEFDRWCKEHDSELFDTFTVQTAHGYHYYFNAGDYHYGNTNPFKKSGYNVDVRGNGDQEKNGGYVIGFGSYHSQGHIYRLINHREPIMVPENLHRFLTSKPQALKPLARPDMQVSLNKVLSPAMPQNRAYIQAGVEAVLRELQNLQHVPEGVEPRWDNTTYACASRLIELGNHPESPYTLSSLERMFMENAPTSHDFGAPQHAHKWQDAVKNIGTKQTRIPDRQLSVVRENATVEPQPVDSLEEKIGLEVERLHIRQEAKRRFDAQQAEKIPPPIPVKLKTFLEQPDEETAYLIDGLWPKGGKIILVAQAKTGKTTMVNNMLRCLADGEDFLDTFPTRSVGKIVLIDNEMSENQLRRWLRAQNIHNVDRVDILSIRGSLTSFNILEPEARKHWADTLRDADVVIFDCLRPVLDAIGLDENKDAGRFLAAFDELMKAANVSNYLIVHHMGHQDRESGRGRARGDSRIKDWPDATLTLTLDKQGDNAWTDVTRYFQATGRDVDQPRKRLKYDPQTQHLSLTSETPAQIKAQGAVEPVYEYIEDNPGCSKNDIEHNIPGLTRGSKEAAIKMLEVDGRIRIEKTTRAHRLYAVSPHLPEPPHGGRGDKGRATSPAPHRIYNTGSGELLSERDKVEEAPTCPLHRTPLDNEGGCDQCKEEL
ncbi:AAA family ATPase [Arcanobacterium phocae]|uniref:AAA family ATPase n=1 Tax=Arcanobacterium phocae TaxID=131112 RepID=UPI001C0F1C1F|nr:AAA family ATPase [Arcanobacterium phocae]